jgi:hypothetical protein
LTPLLSEWLMERLSGWRALANEAMTDKEAGGAHEWIARNRPYREAAWHEHWANRLRLFHTTRDECRPKAFKPTG